MKMNIPFSPPDVTEEEILEVTETLRSGWLTTGPKTKKFEKEIAKYCRTNFAVALNSATACMEMTLRMLGVGPGDEVITSAYTYTASASVIHHVGAKIVLVDTAPNSFEMDYESLVKKISKKTKVIIPVDIAGVMCDYDTIFKVVQEKKGLFEAANEIQNIFGRVIVLSDAAHSFGAKYKNIRSGGVADFTSFSFHAVKNLTTAEGGAVTWKSINDVVDNMIYTSYMNLSLHGQTKDALEKNKLGAWEYDVVAPNYKCNMTDIMASIGLVQLKRYETLLAKRHELIKEYDNLFKEFPVDILSHENLENYSSGHLYLVRFKKITIEQRNLLIEKMAEKGVSTNVHYKPLPLLTAYRDLGFDIKDYPEAFAMYENEITFPLYSTLKLKEVNYIMDTLRETLKDVC